MIYINDEIEELPLEIALQQISEQRREQALKFKHEQGQRLSVAAYLLLKEGLRQEFGFTYNPIFGYHANGKPYIDGCPDIHFNMSHCRKAAICGVSRQPIGVDIESIHPYKENLAAYTMNEQELDLIHRSPRPDVAFTQLWTRKEALLKLTGEGIHNNIKNVLIEAEGRVKWTTTVHLQKQYIYSICEFH